jgi:hypothetical protein
MMDRTQKKCLIGSSMMHGLLLGVLCFGAAFSKPQEKVQFLEFIPPPTVRVTDGPTRGGSPVAAPPVPQPMAQPQPAPQQPAPAPKPVEQPREVVQPKPVKTFVEETKVPIRNADIAIAPTKTRKPKVELTLTTRGDTRNASKKPSKDKKPTTRDDSDSAADDRARQKLAKEFRGAATSLRESGTGSVSIESVGFTGSGEAAVNFRELVFSTYDHAWREPDDVSDDFASVKTEITVTRDGSASGRILKRSGITSMDRSVQNALDRVRFIRAFPAEARESERTYIIVFNLKSKRGIG